MTKEEEEVREGPFSGSEDHKADLRDYVFKLKSGEDQVATGFLAIAGGFIAVGSGSGDLSFIVPASELQYCRELPKVAGSA